MRGPRNKSEDPLASIADARSFGNPGAKLLDAARDLFNEHGYASAGINEIIQRSQTSKKSFYHYFPSKKALGEAFLLAEAADLMTFMESMFIAHAGDPGGFAKSWASDLRAKAVRSDYFGCPFANAAAQAPDDFQIILTDIMENWRTRLAAYLAGGSPGISSVHARTLSRRILAEYEGAVAMWRLTRDRSYFSLFEKSLEELLVTSGPALKTTSSRRGKRGPRQKNR